MSKCTSEGLSAAADAGEKSKHKRFLLLVAVACGTLLNPLNTSMISVALSRFQEEYRLLFSELSWLISTYYIASAVAQPVMGKLSDLFGRKRVFLTGLALVTAASALAPLSPGFGWLIGFRIIQAVGSSALYPAGMGLVRQEAGEQQAKAFAVLSVFSSTSAALGPALAGFLIHYGDWPMIFLINFPFIALSFILAVRVMPADVRRERSTVRLDVWGVVLFSALIMVWLLFLLSLRGVIAWHWLGAGVVLGAVFVKYETRQSQPFIDVVFLRHNRQVSLVYAQFILTNVIFYSILFGLPSYLQQVRGLDSRTVGFVMLAMSGSGILTTPVIARWIDRKGSRLPLMGANLFLLAGTLLLLALRDVSPPAAFFWILAVLGSANGGLNLGLQTALYAGVNKAETGIASGMFMCSRFIGTILSSSLLASLFNNEISVGSLHRMGEVSAALGVVMLGMSFALPKREPGSVADNAK